MDDNSNDINLEEDDSEIQLPSNSSIHTDSANAPLVDSTILTHSSSSSSLSDSVFEEIYTKQLTDYVDELKAELQTRCQLDWLSKFEPWEYNPKVELNLLLHGAIREQTLRQLALSKDISYRNDEQIIAKIFQNDHCLLKRIFQEIINDQRQQHIIYTELIFRPDIFNFENKTSNIKLKDVIEVIIDCIRLFTSTDIMNNRISNTILDKTMTKSSTTCNITCLPIHIKIILSCNWNNVKNMIQFIHLARQYPYEIVGIDFYGEENDCRIYWQNFSKYTKILSHYHIRYQASMNNYKDLELINNVINGLHIERLCEAYEILSSSKHIENFLIKHGIYFIICPISNDYTNVNNQINNILLENHLKQKSQSINSLNIFSDEITSYNLINYFQSEMINYSITSLSSLQYKQNLSLIYKNLFEKNQNFFTCEHMQWLNENALKSSFASQELKTYLINYLHENYNNCYKQTIFLKKYRETTNKWKEEINEIIDKNSQIAIEFARKLHKEKLLKHINHQQENSN